MRRGNGQNYGVEPKYILMLCSCLCICLIFLSYKFSSVFEPLRNGINAFITPMQRGITVVGESVNDFFGKFDDVERLKAENETLREKIAELEYANDLLQTDLYDLELYKQLLELAETYVDYPTVGANIIAKDTSGYYATFTIDKGSDQGMAVDMNVIADNGLVGIITEVGKNYAIVRSIIDDNSYVSASILKTSDNCIVSGNLELLDTGFIEVRDISINSEVKNNYKVYTSSLSEKYLPDILIGYISNIQVEADGLSRKGYLTPVVDFEHLNTVLVITMLKESPITGEEEAN